MLLAILFRCFLKDQNPVFEILYGVRASVFPRTMNTIRYKVVCVYMCTYMNFLGRELLVFVKFLKELMSLQKAVSHVDPRCSFADWKRRILVYILMDLDL